MLCTMFSLVGICRGFDASSVSMTKFSSLYPNVSLDVQIISVEELSRRTQKRTGKKTLDIVSIIYTSAQFIRLSEIVDSDLRDLG
jgi:hypothetical protein